MASVVATSALRGLRHGCSNAAASLPRVCHPSSEATPMIKSMMSFSTSTFSVWPVAGSVLSSSVWPRTLGGLRLASTKITTRDPERPKRPVTPWMKFLADFRAKNAATAAPIQGKEVMKAAAVDWKSVSDKSQWEQGYEATKKAYETEMEAYKESGKLGAWKRDPEKPKRPLTGYMRYASEVRPRFSGVGRITEQSKEIAKAWKAQSAGEKLPYEEAYKADKATFDKVMAEYKESGKERAWEEKVGIAAVKDKEAAKKQATKEKDQAKKQTAKEKEQAKKQTAKEKEQAKKQTAKEKEQAKKQKEKEKKQKQAATEKKQAAKEKEDTKKRAAKEKEAAKKEKEKEEKEAAKAETKAKA